MYTFIQHKPFLSLNTVTKRTVFCAYVNLSLLQNLLVSALCHGQTHVHLPTLMALTELTKLLFSSVAFFKFEYNQTPIWTTNSRYFFATCFLPFFTRSVSILPFYSMLNWILCMVHLEWAMLRFNFRYLEEDYVLYV